jgi:hypothetical protein
MSAAWGHESVYYSITRLLVLRHTLQFDYHYLQLQCHPPVLRSGVSVGGSNSIPADFAILAFPHN